MAEQEFFTPPMSEKSETVLPPDQRDCKDPVHSAKAETVTISIYNNIYLRRIFIFYFIYLFICLSIKKSAWFDSYDALFWVELALAAVTVRFVWIDWAEIRPLLKLTHLKWQIAAMVAAIAFAGSLLVSLSAQELNVTFFHSDVSYYAAYKLYNYPVLVMIYSIALMPAIFEELAFRGVMYNFCANFLDERMVVAVTAFLFAIMHLSLISLIWLVPFAFFIGNLRRKYNTLWYGIVFHFIFNLTACFFDLYRQGELF